MYLTIDIGNTRLKYALYQPAGVMVNMGVGIVELERDILTHNIRRCLIASVGDSGSVTGLLEEYRVEYSMLEGDTPLPIQMEYHTPATLGADRIAATIAGVNNATTEAVLVITTGTCITYNIALNRKFIGGAISPGVAMRFRALHDYTEGLPQIRWSVADEAPADSLIGRTTEHSMRNGVLTGIAVEIDGTIDKYRERYEHLSCFLTGGDSDHLVKHLKNNIFARPDMVLEGLYHILHYNA